MKHFLTVLASMLLASSFAAGCAAQEEDLDDEEKGETTAAQSAYVTGKCPDNHVCAYANANFNDRNPTSAWAYQFGPEELYPGAIGRKFSRRFTGGKDKVSSVINNSSKRMCLYNERNLGYSRDVLVRINPGQKLSYVGAGANDKADVIEEC